MSPIVFIACGHLACSDVQLSHAIRLLNRFQKVSSKGIARYTIMQINRKQYRSERPNSLLDLPTRTAHYYFSCSDPRDRVYAVLALQDERESSISSIDYGESVEDVYLDTARAIIQHTASLQILSIPQGNQSMPSWVPDWRYQRLYDSSFTRNFSCSKNLPHVFEKSSSTSLIVRGQIIVRITDVAAAASGGAFTTLEDYLEKWFDRLKVFREMLNYLENHSLCGIVETDKERYMNWLLAMTLTQGKVNTTFESEFSTSTLDTYSDCSKLFETCGISAVNWLAENEEKSLAILERYKMGLVLKKSQSGDLVCILYSSELPLVLRRSGQSFTVVGSCYVQGIMFGEAVNELESQKVRSIVITTSQKTSRWFMIQGAIRNVQIF